MKKNLIFIFVVIGASFLLSLTLQSQQDSTNEFCISQEELKLYNLVNELRNINNLPQIPISNSLCRVAKMHIDDLIQNKPDTSTCSFHSWSNKGNWQDCCFTKESKDKLCMQNKPGELTGYSGKGYEVVYWESREASAQKAIDQWKETCAATSIILHTKEWQSFNWKALGVGVDGGFAVIWLGEESDPETLVKVCGGEPVKSQPVAKVNIEVKSDNTNQIIIESQTNSADNLVVSEGTGRFYLIFGNYRTLPEAKSIALKYAKEGFPEAKVISKDNKFRISLADYSSKESAAAGKKELPDKFKEAWIMPFYPQNELSQK